METPQPSLNLFARFGLVGVYVGLVPIFLGMLALVFGMTLWSPSVVTVALLVATYIALEVQIRGEEAYLGQMHGEAYRNYCARVRRWL